VPPRPIRLSTLHALGSKTISSVRAGNASVHACRLSVHLPVPPASSSLFSCFTYLLSFSGSRARVNPLQPSQPTNPLHARTCEIDNACRHQVNDPLSLLRIMGKGKQELDYFLVVYISILLLAQYPCVATGKPTNAKYIVPLL
jgi:hypothetical protein